VQTSQKKHAISAVHCKKEGMLLQPLRWRCAESAVHHERNVRSTTPIYKWREQAIIKLSWHISSADTNM